MATNLLQGTNQVSKHKNNYLIEFVMKLINKLLTHRIIRYEDFSLDIWNQSLELLQFTGREMTTEVKTFLFHHTSKTEFEGR